MTHHSQKIVALTAYDFTLAKIFDQCGVDIILVGDSLGNVIKGEDSTLGVSIEEMIYHTRCVKRGVSNARVMVDMPYNSDINSHIALQNAIKLQQAGADILKIEGAKFEVITHLIAHNIPICSHLGLEPQSLGTMRPTVQGRDKKSAARILKNAIELEHIGIQMMLLECIPNTLAKDITQSLSIPTIGIGAGVHTSGQILVSYDMLGISEHLPKFVKNFGKETDIITATQNYVNEVHLGIFPNDKFSYTS